MIKWKFALLPIGIVFCNQAFADEGNCIELARIIGTNYSNYLNKDEQRDVAKADMCSESYSSANSTKKAQIAASYNLFSGSASYSDKEINEAQSKHCEGKFGDYWRNQLKTLEQRTVSSEAVSILNMCIAMNGESLYPSIVLANTGQEVAMTMQFKPSAPNSTIDIAQFGPSNPAPNTCKVTKNGKLINVTQPSDVAQRLNALNSVTVTCARSLENTEINGIVYNCTRESIFTVATSGSSKTLKIPRVCTETVTESRADAIEKRLNALSIKVDEDYKALDTHIISVKNGANGQLSRLNSESANADPLKFNYSANGSGGSYPDSPAARCPAGQYVVGINVRMTSALELWYRCASLPKLSIP